MHSFIVCVCVGNVVSAKASSVVIPESVSFLRCTLLIKCDSGNSALPDQNHILCGESVNPNYLILR
jgi:hypothetical protein